MKPASRLHSIGVLGSLAIPQGFRKAPVVVSLVVSTPPQDQIDDPLHTAISGRRAAVRVAIGLWYLLKPRSRTSGIPLGNTEGQRWVREISP